MRFILQWSLARRLAIPVFTELLENLLDDRGCNVDSKSEVLCRGCVLPMSYACILHPRCVHLSAILPRPASYAVLNDIRLLVLCKLATSLLVTICSPSSSTTGSIWLSAVNAISSSAMRRQITWKRPLS